MSAHGREQIARTLVEVEAYKDLAEPVILTSGELGIYYINTEKLLQDDGAWEGFAENSKAMIDHCVEMANKNPSFGNVISIMAEKVQALFPDSVPNEKRMIAGGQRRDWLFSGPIARELGLPHISLHKDRKAYLLSATGESIEELPSGANALDGVYVVHVVDLLTKGSSAYNPNVQPPTGWIVELRKCGAQVDHLVSVVSRLQGAEEILGNVGVNVFAFVNIDSEFVSAYSSNSERALAYMSDPMEWSKAYLKETGIEAFLATFDPKNGKLARAEKFVNVFESTLAELEKLEDLKGCLEKAKSD